MTANGYTQLHHESIAAAKSGLGLNNMNSDDGADDDDDDDDDLRCRRR